MSGQEPLDDQLLDELSSLMQSTFIEDEVSEPPAKKRRRPIRHIRFRDGESLVAVLEYRLNDTIDDLRRDIDASNVTHVLDHHLRRDFDEARRRERTLGGRASHIVIDDVEPQVPGEYDKRFKPILVGFDFATYQPSKVQSSEFVDLQDHRGLRPPFDAIGDTGDALQDPSLVDLTSAIQAALESGNKTHEVRPKCVTLSVPSHGNDSKVTNAVRSTCVDPSKQKLFDEEFVKLDPAIQERITRTAEVLRFLMDKPVLMKGLTAERLDLIEQKLAVTPATSEIERTALEARGVSGGLMPDATSGYPSYQQYFTPIHQNYVPIYQHPNAYPAQPQMPYLGQAIDPRQMQSSYPGAQFLPMQPWPVPPGWHPGASNVPRFNQRPT